MERRMGLVAAGMAARGHRTHIAYLHEGDNFRDTELMAVRLHRIHATSSYDMRLFLRLRSLARQVKPDIIQTWTTQMDILGAFIARTAGSRWILMEPSSVGAYSKPSWKDRIRQFLAGRATIVSNSLAGDAYWRDKSSFRRRVIRNGQDVQRILAAPEFDRSQLPLTRDESVLIYAGRLNSTATRAKNFKICLDAVSRLSSRIPVKLFVCGDGNKRDEWKRKVAEAGLEKQVIFLGYLERTGVWGLMKIADALLSVSRFEGCPNTVQEAMLCRCPLIVSDIPEHREILSDDEAMLVDPNSPAQLSRAVEALISDKAGAAARCENAYKTAREWTVEHMLDQFEELYQELTMSRRNLDHG